MASHQGTDIMNNFNLAKWSFFSIKHRKIGKRHKRRKTTSSHIALQHYVKENITYCDYTRTYQKTKFKMGIYFYTFK